MPKLLLPAPTMPARPCRTAKATVATCQACHYIMEPTCVNEKWAWTCRNCDSPDRTDVPVSEDLRLAELKGAASTARWNTDMEMDQCLHSLTRRWGNASGKGTKCLLCGKELGRPQEELDAEGEPAASSRSRPAGRKAKTMSVEQMEELMDLVQRAEDASTTMVTMLDEGIRKEEAIQKATMRMVRSKLVTEVGANLEIARALLEESQK